MVVFLFAFSLLLNIGKHFFCIVLFSFFIQMFNIYSLLSGLVMVFNVYLNLLCLCNVFLFNNSDYITVNG